LPLGRGQVPSVGGLSLPGGVTLPLGGGPPDEHACQMGQFAQVLQFGRPIGVVQLTPQGWAGPPQLLRHLPAAPAAARRPPPPWGPPPPFPRDQSQAAGLISSQGPRLPPQRAPSGSYTCLEKNVGDQQWMQNPNPYAHPHAGPAASHQRSGRASGTRAQKGVGAPRGVEGLAMGREEASAPGKRQKLDCDSGSARGLEAGKVCLIRQAHSALLKLIICFNRLLAVVGKQGGKASFSLS